MAGDYLPPSSTPQTAGDPTVWNSTVSALQRALTLENLPDAFAEIIAKLQIVADATLKFSKPIFPQKVALDLFVQRCMDSLPRYFTSCKGDVELLHHLQRYAACYVAYKTGYFCSTVKRPPVRALRIKILPPRPQTGIPALADTVDPTNKLTHDGRTAIETFLAECHPPMSHLFEGFQRARITGEIHLQSLARKTGDELRTYFLTSEIAITKTALEVEALVQGLIRRNCAP
ncbi:hypothetical protein R3P38DRAFT_2955179 [Favolaschia claudopus]|uniref:Uncharacterized protein n=1 Tax=Favolaschia claudopus TaxID=2862362 RepID=A0AAW0BCW6_9AGAR